MAQRLAVYIRETSRTRLQALPVLDATAERRFNALALHTGDLNLHSLVRKVKAMCVDRGVESKLADTFGNFMDYMPSWRQPRRVLGDDGALPQDQRCGDARALPHCLVSPKIVRRHTQRGDGHR